MPKGIAKNPEERNKRLSIALKGNTNGFKKGDVSFWKGKKLTQEHKKKLKEAHLKNPTRYWLGKKRPDMTGEKSPSWKGGISKFSNYFKMGDEYKLWRKICLERDNFTCQKYGIRGGKLQVHHINNFADFPELRLAIDNGITLSEKAHKEFHHIYGYKNNTREQLIEFLNK